MCRKSNIPLISLLTILMLLISLPYTKAKDVCAENGLYSDNVDTLCPEACKTVEGTWNGQWRGKTDAQCKDPNTYGSVCGCTDEICECGPDNKQSTTCNEGKNKLGPNKCASDCDCIAERVCVKGECADKPPNTACCNQCFLASLSCEGRCNTLPAEDQPGCLWPCLAAWDLCTSSKCGGCPSEGREKLKALIEELSSKDKESPAEKEAPIINEPTKEKEPLNHEEHPAKH